MGTPLKGGGIGAALGAAAFLIPGVGIPLGLGIMAGTSALGMQKGAADVSVKSAKEQQSKLLAQQQAQTEVIRQNLLQKPKLISPDNFLTTKASQLARLRLGLASTTTAKSGVPPPTLSAPALVGSGAGKSKLGQ